MTIISYVKLQSMLFGEIDFGVLAHHVTLADFGVLALICVVLVVQDPKVISYWLVKYHGKIFTKEEKNILSLDKCCRLNT